MRCTCLRYQNFIRECVNHVMFQHLSKCMEIKYTPKLTIACPINVVYYICYVPHLYHIVEVSNQISDYKQLAQVMSDWLLSHSQHEKQQENQSSLASILSGSCFDVVYCFTPQTACKYSYILCYSDIPEEKVNKY